MSTYLVCVGLLFGTTGACKRAEKAEQVTREVASGLMERSQEAVEGVQSLLERGKQVAHVASEIARVLGEVVDSQTTIDPICQRLDDESAQAETDAAIGQMPRTEVVDGVTVGFEDVSQLHVNQHSSSRGFLVLWRQGSYRVGLLYRTQRDIHLDRFVEEAPGLIALTREVMSDSTDPP